MEENKIIAGSNPTITITKTFKEQRLENLANLPEHPDFELISGLPIPIGDAILVKECPQTEYKTSAGIIIPGGDTLNHCKIGVVYAIGETCSIPVKLGDTVAFDQMCRFGIKHKDVGYISVASHMTYFIVPPSTYFEPHYKDFMELRREKRLAGAKAVEKRDNEDFGKKLDIRANEGKTQFAVTKDFKKP